jgi:apolipoprotein N-acyltransferase
MTSDMVGSGPIVRLADWFRRLNGWRRYAAAVAAGAVTSVSLPPADAMPLLWIGIPALLWLLEAAPTRAKSFWIGWAFGFGYLAFSLYWLTFALFVALDKYWWLIPFGSNGLSFGLAIFWAFAAWLASFAPRDRPLARVFALVAMLGVFEWLRGHLLTGFPWNLPGYAWTDFPWLIQSAAWIGIYGVTLLALLAPALAAPCGSRYATIAQARGAAAAGVLVLVAAAIAGMIRLPAAPMPTVPDLRIRLVQPNIAQGQKWVPSLYADNLRRQIELSLTPAGKPPNVIVWSEAAEPYPLDGHPDNAIELARLLKLQPGQLLVTGIARDMPDADPPSFRDSIQALDSSGRIIATYDKFHYVPFGEYMPLRRWLPIVKAVAVGDVEPTAGPGPVTLHLPGLPPAGPLICYEVIFPHAVIDPENRPQWLLDVTNDAWFGLSAGPYQHFAMMRVRAVEEGLPLANAANDGISGVVDPYGRVTAILGLGKTGIVDADLPRALPATLYEKFGDIPFFIMAAGLTAVAIALGRRGVTPRGALAQPAAL